MYFSQIESLEYSHEQWRTGMKTLIRESLQSVLFVLLLFIAASWSMAQIIDYTYIRYAYAETGHPANIPWMAGRQEWNFTPGEERSNPAANK
jgi:hypothetical protein